MRSLVGSLLNKTPVPYVGSNGNSGYRGLWGGVSGRDAQIATMGQSGIVFAIVSKCASGTASQTWDLYTKPASGKKEDRVAVTRHPALEVLSKPNEFMTRQDLFESVEQHVELTGEGYFIVEFGEGTTLPIGLWYATPSRMEPVKSETEFLTGWIYKSPDGDIPLTRDEVIQIRMPNPADPYRGLGPVQTVLGEIEAAKFATIYNKNFFKNDATPGGIVEVPTTMSDPEFEQFVARWRATHQGISAAHTIGVLENNMKYVQTGSSAKDMQFVELQSMSDEKVRQAFGFPKPLTGAVDDVNRANAEAAEYVFAKWLLVPRLNRIKQALNNGFLKLFGTNGQGLEFDYCSPVAEDEIAEQASLASKVSAVVALVAQGYDPTVALQVMGLPEIPFIGKAGALV
jgi:HK97 family phage portal protein